MKMNRQLLCVSLLASVVAGLPSIAAAQFPPPPPPPAGTAVQDRWPQPAPPPTQQQQQQQQQSQPQPAPRQAKPAPQADPDAPKSAPKRRAAAPAHAVTCGGVFNKDATHLKLAIKYDSRNIVFGEVDGPDGTKIKATILYPNESRRRLEVIWNNDAARTDLSLVVINGQSQWVAPKGLKLGTSLAVLEKTNGRPFKLSGLGADGSASVLGWEGGALTSLPGGCKIGIRLVADSKAPADARGAVAGQKELMSNDANLRAIKPTVAEILIGY
jgi:hypothetical protein